MVYICSQDYSGEQNYIVPSIFPLDLNQETHMLEEIEDWEKWMYGI